jgi:excisionase family DNA binding protein
MKSTQQPKLLLTTREVCHALGLSMSTIRRYIAAGVLPHVRVGKRLMVSSQAALSFAQNGVSLQRLEQARRVIQETTGETANDRG